MKRELIYYGHPNLRKRCQEVGEITDEVHEIAQDLFDTVIEDNGAGLAAPQINRLFRMFVIRYENCADSDGMPIMTKEPKLYINPKISSMSKEAVTISEGCLSIPGTNAPVTRPEAFVVEAMDLDGQIFTEEVSGWRARVILHENDHLNGVLFVDRVDAKLKRQMERKLKALKIRTLSSLSNK